MTWKKTKEKLNLYQVMGASTPIGAITYKTHCPQWWVCAVAVSQLTFFGLIFTEAFLIARFAFKKSNQESVKIGGIAIGAVVAGVVLFAITDYFIRAKILKETEPGEDVFSDVLLLEAATTFFIPTILGAIQVEGIAAYNNRNTSCTGYVV